MVRVKRWMHWLIIAASLYAAIALYGTLRPLGLDPLRSLFVCALYSMGFFNLIVIFLSSFKWK